MTGWLFEKDGTTFEVAAAVTIRRIACGRHCLFHICPLVACIVSSLNCWSDPFLRRRQSFFPYLRLPTLTLSRSFKRILLHILFTYWKLGIYSFRFSSHHGPRTQRPWRTGAKKLPNAQHTRIQHGFYGDATAAVSSFLNDATVL